MIVYVITKCIIIIIIIIIISDIYIVLVVVRGPWTAKSVDCYSLYN